MSVRGLHDAWLQATAQCDGPAGNADCQAGTVHATIEVLRSEVVLADSSPPTAGAASGSAVSSATWQGTETFAFAAADEGGGVYQAVLEVDGAPVLARTIDDRDGRCVDTTAGAHVFTRPQPCPAAADALVRVDAAALPAGDHDVALRVSDAAGNVRTVYAARKTIAGPAAPVAPAGAVAERGDSSAGDPAFVLVARWARTGRTTLTAPYGVRSVIRGRLTDAAGAGVGNARIELLGAVDGRRGMALDKGGARTRADGRFTLVVPRGASSRTLLLRYRRHGADTAAAQARLRLRVRAGVALSLAPRPGQAAAPSLSPAASSAARSRARASWSSSRRAGPATPGSRCGSSARGSTAASPRATRQRAAAAASCGPSCARPPTTRTRPAPPGPCASADRTGTPPSLSSDAGVTPQCYTRTPCPRSTTASRSRAIRRSTPP